MLKRITIVLLVLFSCYAADKTAEPEFWGTGPLLAPSGDFVEPGHVDYEPFIVWSRQKGVYDKHWKFHSTPLFTTIVVEPEFRFGLAPNIEFDITPIAIYNHTQHTAQWVLGDMPLALEFLLCKDNPQEWTHPNLILRLLANLPVGKYQKLSLSKKGTDVGGTGSWFPGVGLLYYHITHLWDSHFLTSTAYVSYQFGTPASVKRQSIYGGDTHTYGTAYAGNIFFGVVSFEFSLTQNWVLALDSQYLHLDRSRFTGHRGGSFVKSPSSEQLSLAPALEYNWSKNVGIIGGIWFTAAGRNALQFVAGVIAVTINS